MSYLKDIANKTIKPPANKRILRYPEIITKNIVREVLDTFQVSYKQTNDFAKYVLDDNIYETCKNAWFFIKDNIPYKEDPADYQDVRTPEVTWWNKIADCKSYSILIGSIVKNLSIPFSFRFAGYIKGGRVTHVYCIAHDKGRDIIIDACMPQFNTEKPFQIKKDYNMSGIYRITGTGKSPEKAPANIKKHVDKAIMLAEQQLGHKLTPGTKIEKKVINFGSKPLSELLEGELDLMIAKDRLLTEKAIVEKVRGIGSLKAEKYQDSIDMLDDALDAINEHQISGIGIEDEFDAIISDAISGVYSIAGSMIGKSKSERKETRKEKKAERKELRQEKKEIRQEKKEIKKTTSGAEKKEALKELRQEKAKAIEEHGTKTGKFLKKTADKVKKGLKAVAKVLTATQQLIIKGILEVSLPKAAPFFLYTFIKDPAITAKLPAKAKAKKDKAEKLKSFIVDTIGMKENHFQGIVRNGIMKKTGMSPENYIAKLMQGKVSGIGLIGEAIEFLMEIIKKISSIFGKKPDVDITDDDGSDSSDFADGITDTDELAKEVTDQTDTFDIPNEDGETSGGTSIWNSLK